MWGWVYVLVSSEKPELVKIGQTSRDPETRAKELSSDTGVSMPYIVAYQVETVYASEIESAVHRRLSDSRVNPNREFFRVRTRKAIQTIRKILDNRPTDFTEAVAQTWSLIDRGSVTIRSDEEKIRISALEQNDIEKLRNVLYRRFGKKNVIVRYAQQEDGSYVAVIRHREDDTYLRG